MVKKAARPLSVPGTVTVDNESFFSSQRRPAILKPKKHGEPRLIGKVKNVGSNVPRIENLLSQHHSRKNKHVTVHNRPYPDQMVQSNKFGVSYSAISGQVKGANGVELSTRIDAALALMELANERLALPKNRLYFNANHMPTSVLIDQLNDTISHSYPSPAAGCMTEPFKNFQLSAVDKEEYGDRLCEEKKKFGNAVSLLPRKYKNDGDFEEDNFQGKGWQHFTAFQGFDCDPLGMSVTPSFDRKKVEKRQKKKKTAGPFVSGMVEDDCDHLYSRMVLDEPPISSLKKRGLKKRKTDACSSFGLNANAFISKRAKDTAVLETKPLRKLQLRLMSPNVHKVVSFSIIHFLSAIRVAMLTPDAEEDIFTSKHLSENNSNIAQIEKIKLPSLTIHEILDRVRRNPIDPCILEAQEPLEDLLRGALNIFSSKLAPLGANGWQPLTSYLKLTKSWSWIGPISFKQDEAIKEEISAEAWGLPGRMLARLVDSFANWLGSVQETLQQIKSLPAPPMTSMQRTAHLEQRLKSARPRKCTATISPCSAELRAYFHKEEALRYSVPERAFSYTAVDGRKSTVAPMRRSSGKPSSKVRDHFMLKAHRPPHVTVLCLVRDAAARLPENMGTRTDICTLMRDSQYIIEDVSDEQLNQVVSRGLDRLHYENDPCVQYNGDTKLWVYLHGDREVDDFEDDGTENRRPR